MSPAIAPGFFVGDPIMTGFDIREVRETEIADLPAIEADAAEAFREIGLGFIADQPPMTAAQYGEIAADGAVLIAVSESGDLLGFAALGRIDGQAWLKEMSVRREQAGQGIGQALLSAASRWAGDNGFEFLLLTTFVGVPFNGPFYRRAGFREVDPDPRWPQLAKIRKAERQSGIEVRPRIAMKLAL